MIVLLWALCAQADPGVLRAPGAGEAVTAAIAWPDVAVGGWLGPKLGVYGAARSRLQVVEVGVGTVAALTGADRSWGVDAVLSAGLLAPRVRPTLGIATAPSVRGGLRSDAAHATFGLVLPIELDLMDPVAPALSLLGELRVGAKAGPVWLAVSGALGPQVVPGGLLAFDGSIGGSIGFVPTQ